MIVVRNVDQRWLVELQRSADEGGLWTAIVASEAIAERLRHMVELLVAAGEDPDDGTCAPLLGALLWPPRRGLPSLIAEPTLPTAAAPGAA